MEYFDDPRGIPDKPPPKPAARRIPGAIKGPVIPRKMHRGPRFRAIQAIMASLGESQSAAPPPAVSVFEPDTLAEGSSARDIARARAARLAVEALRVNQKENVSETEDPGTAPAAVELDSSESGDDNSARECVAMMGPEKMSVDYTMAQPYLSGPEYRRDSDGRQHLANHVFRLILPDVNVEQSQYGVAPPLPPAAYVDVQAGRQGAIGGNGQATGKKAKAQVSCWNIDPALAGFTSLERGDTAANRQDSGDKVLAQEPWETIPFHRALEPLGRQIGGSGSAYCATEVIPEMPPAVAYTGDESYSPEFLFEALLFDGLPPSGQKADDSHGKDSLEAGSNFNPLAPLQAPIKQVTEAINETSSGSAGNYARSPTCNSNGGLICQGAHCDALVPVHTGEQATEGGTKTAHKIDHGAADIAVRNPAPYPESNIPPTSDGHVASGNSGASSRGNGDIFQSLVSPNAPSASSTSLGTNLAVRPQADAPAFTSTHKETGTGLPDLPTDTQNASIFDNDIDNKLLDDFNFFILNVSPEAPQMSKEEGEANRKEAGRNSEQGGRSGSRV